MFVMKIMCFQYKHYKHPEEQLQREDNVKVTEQGLEYRTRRESQGTINNKKKLCWYKVKRA